jgi:hypothetical protein
MPKVAMDFSKTVIYHFVCKDEMIKCLYVGSTTNFNKRKANHKSACNIETSKDYQYKVYQTIREHGGWNNWCMKPLEEFPCENKTQQVIREQFWIDKLKPEMNCKVAHREGENEYEKNKAYRDANPEMIKEKKSAFYQANKQVILQQHKAYNKTNAEAISEKRKVYREANKQVLSKKKKEWREANIEELKQYRSVKYTCGCGSVFCVNDKARHERSMKHQSFIALTPLVVV